MKCFCQPGSPGCLSTGVKQCKPNIRHCLLVLQRNASVNSFTEGVQDCWHWGDTYKCPDVPGPCIVHSHDLNGHVVNTCCCMGELCNNSTAVNITHPEDLNNSSGMVGVSNISRVTVLPDRFDSSKVVYIAVSLFSVIFILLILLLLLRRRYPHLRVFRTRKFTSRFSKAQNCKANRLSDSIIPHNDFGSNVYSLRPTNLLDDSDRKDACGLGNFQHNLTDFENGWSFVEVENIASKVTKLELKSKGCFGQVWHGHYCPASSTSNKIDVAIKIFRMAQRESWENEVSSFRVPGLAHPNILKYFGADQVPTDCSTPLTDSVDYDLWIVSEYHPLGSLHDYLKSETIDWPQLLNIATSIARGLAHLHAEVHMNLSRIDNRQWKPSIAHRDLNSRNILLKSDFSACIADFGLAIRFEAGQFSSNTHPQIGTRRYMAPEVLDGAIHFSRDAYLRIDVYAMGLVFWELMSRCRGTDNSPIQPVSRYYSPYEIEIGPNPLMEHLREFVAIEKRRPLFSTHWSGFNCLCTLWETIEECWDQDAEARLSAGCVVERLTTLGRRSWCGIEDVGKHSPSPHANPNPTYNTIPECHPLLLNVDQNQDRETPVRMRCTANNPDCQNSHILN